MALDEVIGWVPLGNLAPPAHVFPSNHQGLYVADPRSPILGPPRTVRAPGNLHVFRVRSSHHQAGSAEWTDYSIEFQPCADISGYLGHVQTLAPAFADRLGPIDRACGSYSVGAGMTVTTCETALVDVPFSPGEVIGTTGGVPHVFGMDFGLYDRRIPPHEFANPARWESNSLGFDHFHVVPASDYFAEPARSAIAAKIGDGVSVRTIPPLGGTNALDVRGTAQGAWFKPGEPTYPEAPHLGLMLDYIDPTFHVFSIGTSHGGPIAAVRFQPASSGTVNRAFAIVVPGATVYCYDTTFSGITLMRLDTPTSLSLQVRLGPPFTCAAADQPWTFNEAATVQYER